MVGQNVVQLLGQSFASRQINIEIVAILNDTTGTLMSCAWKDHETFVGNELFHAINS